MRNLTLPQIVEVRSSVRDFDLIFTVHYRTAAVFDETVLFLERFRKPRQDYTAAALGGVLQRSLTSFEESIGPLTDAKSR